jgi:hypothetical protein
MAPPPPKPPKPPDDLLMELLRPTVLLVRNEPLLRWVDW